MLSSLQTLAIYDRFGRLMYGQEDVPRDVLEYVVFEKHLANPYGSWRMHGKIVPPWAPPKQPILKVKQLHGLRCAKLLESYVQFFATPCTVAHQDPLSMGLSWEEYWSGLPRPPPGDFPHPGIEPPASCVSCIGRRVLYP